MTLNLAVLGINFKTAPLELRERFSLSPTHIPAALRNIMQQLPGAEPALLSTCNRVELYVAGSENTDLNKESLLSLLAQSTGVSLDSDAEEHFYMRNDLAAVEHLMAVGSSLNSMVVGETEILGQVKQAYAIATELQANCKQLHQLFQAAITAAKRVHAETDICRGRVSVSSIAVDFAQKVFESLSAKSVMIVGAGETGELTLKSLVDKGAKEIFVLNRSLEKGKAIAEQYGGTAVQFDLLEEYLTRSDIVISCTGAPHCVIKVHAVRNAVAARHNQPILLIDIAVPRDIEEDVGKLENVYLYHIDDLHRVAGENMAKRQKAVEHAWRIVRKEAAEFAALDGGIVLLMKEIDDRAREIKETELIKAFRKEKLAPLPEPCKEEIRMMVHRVINKVLAAPRDVLNEAARNGRWEKYASVARSLFKLGGENDDGDR